MPIIPSTTVQRPSPSAPPAEPAISQTRSILPPVIIHDYFDHAVPRAATTVATPRALPARDTVIPSEHPAWCAGMGYEAAAQRLRGMPPGTWLMRPSVPHARNDPAAGTYHFILAGVDDRYQVQQHFFVWQNGSIHPVVPSVPPRANSAITYRGFDGLSQLSYSRGKSIDQIAPSDMTGACDLNLSNARVLFSPNGIVRNSDGMELTNQYTDVRSINFSHACLLHNVDHNRMLSTDELIATISAWRKFWPNLKDINLLGCHIDQDIVQRAFPNLRIEPKTTALDRMQRELQLIARGHFDEFLGSQTHYVRAATRANAHAFIAERFAGPLNCYSYVLRPSDAEGRNTNRNGLRYVGLSIRSPSPNDPGYDLTLALKAKPAGIYMVNKGDGSMLGPAKTIEQVLKYIGLPMTW